MSLLQKEHYSLCLDASSMNRLRRDIGGKFIGTLHKYDYDHDPGKNDDANTGFVPGSICFNKKEERAFMCMDNTAGHAKWILLGETEKYGDTEPEPAKSEMESFEQEVINNIDTDLVDSDIPHKEILIESGQVSNLDDILEIYAEGETSRKNGLASIDGVGQAKADAIEEWILSSD